MKLLKSKTTMIELIIIFILLIIVVILSSSKSHALEENYTEEEQTIINLTYPVGSVLENDDENFNPNEEYSWQTWEKIEGKMLMSSGTINGTTYTVGQTGGNNDAVVVAHSHIFTGLQTTLPTLTWDHTHTVSIGAASSIKATTGSSMYKSGTSTTQTSSSSGAHTHTFTASGEITNSGESSTDKNLPSYHTVNIWKRVS